MRSHGRRAKACRQAVNWARKAFSKATFVTVPLFAHKKAFEMIKAGEANAYVDLRDQLASYTGELPGARNPLPQTAGRVT